MQKTVPKRDYSVSITAAGLYSLAISTPIGIVLGIIYAWAWVLPHPWNQTPAAAPEKSLPAVVTLLFYLALFIAGAVLHELIHALAWVWAGKKTWKVIRFGIDLNTLSPYAHILEPIPAGAYRFGAILPGLLTGLLPALLGIAAGNLWLFIFGVLFVFAAGGDFVVLFLIRKVPAAALIEDHPTQAGCYILEE